MAIGSNTETKNLNFWEDGMPSEDIQSGSTDLTKVTFWVDGMPYVTVYPSTANTGAMMQLIWGVE